MKVLTLTRIQVMQNPMRFWFTACIALLLFLTASATIRADGFIIPIPPPRVEIVPDLAVKYHHVQVTIEDLVAQTKIDQVFLNDSPYDLEGTYIFPLPEEAAISDFAMFVDGQRLAGKILDKEEARRTYESIVRRRRDPALLEYVGRNAFQASIYPIPAHGEKRVQLAYSQVLPADNALIHYVYPLDTERFSSRPLEEVVITVDLHSHVPMKAIYSPSHNVVIERTSETSALVSFEANNIRPDKDFELYYSVSEDDIGVHLLSYKEQGEDGFFLLIVAPKMEAGEGSIVAKDVILVLDTSGSMEGQKLQQAKEALTFVLDHLQQEDRFNIIAFNTSISKYATGLRPASESIEARQFVRRLSAGGGTNIHRALLEALEMVSSERPQFIIFLTDGLPTAGETDLARILADVKRLATKNVRMFTFGVGYDVNTALLDTLSQEHRGVSAYVEPEQSIEEVVSSFYSKISAPILSDLRLQIQEVTIEDLYPYPLPDLFAGSQLLVVGRYREGGKVRITLHGMLNGAKQSFRYSNVYFSQQGGQDFVPRLWATRKIGYLLKEIRLHGENRELVESIVSLSVRYGIITPYTSFLVDEGQDILTEAGRRLVAESNSFPSVTSMPLFGAEAVADSQTQNKLAQAERGGESESTEIRLVGNKTFVLRNNIWTDTTYDPQQMHVTHLQLGSANYFTLLAEHPQWGKYFAVGKRVIVVLGGRAYQVKADALEAQDSLVANPQALSPWEQFWHWFCAITKR
ncbi:MAG: VIT domain-containing protein [Anaerolineae bacterium]